MADADGKMRITKKVREKRKTRNADGRKRKKQTNDQLRKEIFLSSRCHMVEPFKYIQNVMPIVGTVLYRAINVTEIRTLLFSSLNAHILGALLL